MAHRAQQLAGGQGGAPLRGAGGDAAGNYNAGRGDLADQCAAVGPEAAPEAAPPAMIAPREAPRYMGYRPQPDGPNSRKGQRGREGVRASRAAAARVADGDAPRASLYDDVTDRIIAELESGRVPWAQPWGSAACGPALPRNALTARAYSGVNVLILWGAVIAQGYPTQNWLTFKQARDAGGAVLKGERGTTVVYADRFTPRDRKDEALRGSDSLDRAEKTRAREAGDAAKAIPFLKRFTVFNVAQCEGLKPRLAADPAPLPERAIVPVAEELIAASGVQFRIGGPRAFYVPARDVVHVPPQPAFFDQINYYRTALHELTHATGHPSRLGRDQTGSFGSALYAREELIAEMGSAFLCASLGIVPSVRHADYLSLWLDVLRADNRAIFRAASAASKAADWLLAQPRANPAQSENQDNSDGEGGAEPAPKVRHAA